MKHFLLVIIPEKIDTDYYAVFVQRDHYVVQHGYNMYELYKYDLFHVS